MINVIGVDLGTSVTKIYSEKTGILSIPSFLTIDKSEKRPKIYVGDRSKRTYLKTPDKVNTYRFMSRGWVSNDEYARMFLEEVINKYKLKRNGTVIANIPTKDKYTRRELDDTSNIFKKIGFDEVYFIDSLVAAALGTYTGFEFLRSAELDKLEKIVKTQKWNKKKLKKIKQEKGYLSQEQGKGKCILGLGEGLTQLGTFCFGNISETISLDNKQLGLELNDMIRSYIKKTHNIDPEFHSVEKIIGELLYAYKFGKAKEKSVQVKGFDKQTSLPRYIEMYGSEIADFLYPHQSLFFDHLGKELKHFLENLQCELAGDLAYKNNPVILTGGIANMRGITLALYYLFKKEMRFERAYRPEQATIRGIRRIIENEDLGIFKDKNLLFS